MFKHLLVAMAFRMSKGHLVAVVCSPLVTGQMGPRPCWVRTQKREEKGPWGLMGEVQSTAQYCPLHT